MKIYMSGFCRSLCLTILLFSSLNAEGSEPLETYSYWFKPSNSRYRTFEKAFSLMEERNVRVIIETGTTRGNSLESIFAGDGGSTLLFCNWAMKHSAKVFSVDIYQGSFDAAKPFVQPYGNCFFPVCSDSVAFLEKFQGTIDFLYLDSFDFDQQNPLPSQEHHLKEIIAAYPKLTPSSIILIDDCGLPHGGKGAFVINYLLERGWKILMSNYQVLLIRDEG